MGLIVVFSHSTFSPAIRVDWKMFNVLLKDDKILDFIAYIGEPFPRQPTNSLVKACMRHSDSLDKEGNSALSLSSEGGECEGGEGGEGGEGRIVRVLLKPHEGVLCFEPFDIHPKQMASEHTYSTNQKKVGVSVPSRSVQTEIHAPANAVLRIETVIERK